MEQRGLKRRYASLVTTLVSAGGVSVVLWVINTVGSAQTVKDMYDNWPSYVQFVAETLLWPPFTGGLSLLSLGLFVYYDRVSRHLVSTSASGARALDIQHHADMRALLVVKNLGPESTWTAIGKITAFDGKREGWPSLPFHFPWAETDDTHLRLKTNGLGMVALAHSTSVLGYKNRQLSVQGSGGQWNWHREKDEPPEIELEVSLETDTVGEKPIVIKYVVYDTMNQGAKIRRL